MTDTPREPDEPEIPDIQQILNSLTGGGNADLSGMLEQLGMGQLDPAMMQQLQAQMAAMMSGPAEGGLNMDLARDIARKTVAAAGDPSIGNGTRRDVEQVVSVANLWLDAVTDFSSTGIGTAWSRAEWVEATMPTWRRLVEPVAEAVNSAIQTAMRRQMEQFSAETAGIPAGMMGQMEPMMARMSSGMFSAQLGQAVGTLAGEIVTGTEVGLPLVADNPIVVLPSNVASFAEGLGVDAGQVHLYLAVREAARTRLFAAVPWLAPALLVAVQSYAADITIDTDAVEGAIRGADPSDPAAMQEALQGSMFHPQPSADQRRALDNLETLLALVEGWVDTVSAQAVSPHLPDADALAEAVRRRRATGGAAEKVFASLVGLELRPRRLRDAANLFAALSDDGGSERRDGAWKHPDLAPTAKDLDDPMGYVTGDRAAVTTADEPDAMDSALAQLLAQGTDELRQEREGASEAPEGGTADTPGAADSADASGTSSSGSGQPGTGAEGTSDAGSEGDDKPPTA